MSDCRRGTGAHCNCDDALVAILMSRLTTDELVALDGAHVDVVMDSIAEARERKERSWQLTGAPLFRGTRKKAG